MATPQGGLSSIANADPAAGQPLLQPPQVNTQGGLSSIESATPTAGQVDPVAQARAMAMQLNPNDPMNRFAGQTSNMEEFNSYVRSTRPDAATMQAAQQAWEQAQAQQAQAQQATVQQLQQNVSEERATALNWQALGQMGAAMLANPTNAWGAGQTAYMDARGKNQQTLDTSAIELRTANQALSDQAVTAKQAQYAALLKQQEDAMKYQEQALSARAAGGQEWTVVQTETGPMAFNKLDPKKSYVVSPKYFIEKTMEARLQIDKAHAANADAIRQWAMANGQDPAEVMEALKQRDYAEFDKLNPNPFRGVAVAETPVAELQNESPKLLAVPPVAEPSAQLQNESPKLLAVLRQADHFLKVRDNAALNSPERLAANTQLIDLKKQVAAMGATLDISSGPKVPKMPVLDTPALEGSKTTATKTAEAAVAKTSNRGATEAAFVATMQGLDRILGTVDEILNAPGMDRITGPMGLIPNFPGSAAADAEALLRKNLLAQVGFQELKNMRDTSPSGAALGNVSNVEIEFLQNTMAALSKEQSTKGSIAQLKKIRAALKATKAARVAAISGAYKDFDADAVYTKDMYPVAAPASKELPADIQDIMKKYPPKK